MSSNLATIILFVVIAFVLYGVFSISGGKCDNGGKDEDWLAYLSLYKSDAGKTVLNCPSMRSAGIKLTDRDWMRDNWRRVVDVVESGVMPPSESGDIFAGMGTTRGVFLTIVKNLFK